MMVNSHLGRMLVNRYQLNELIGKGAMGQVYLARDRLLGDIPVAVKFLSRALLNDKMRDRFRSEAKTCAQLSHKSLHIVRVMDYGVDEEEVPFYVMEYLRGESLSNLIRSNQITLPRFLSLVRQICLGLQCAHQGKIIHRDIKPSNILIVQDISIGELAKVLDFGIAHILSEAPSEKEKASSKAFMGTLAYASPEQMTGEDLDERSDIYSLGVVMYQMLTLKLPLNVDTHDFNHWYQAHHHQTPKPFEVANPLVRLPKALCSVVMSCLEKRPCDRPQSMEDILTALAPFGERFEPGRQMSQRIEGALSKLPVVTTTAPQAEERPTTEDEICRFSTWPKDKPLAEIVFPQPLRSPRSTFATLWAMFPEAEIQKREISTRYNHWLFVMSPHPMVLWITAIYNPEHGPRWLPCYLDLKTAQGQEMARLLAQKGYYRMLFFAQESPEQCSTMMVSTVAPTQCQRLEEWANTSQTLPDNRLSHLSKQQLKQEFDKIKPAILLKLETLYTFNPPA